jgi:NADPH:quinone reductase
VYGDLVTILEPDSSIGNLKVARNRNLRISLELMLTPALMGLENARQKQVEILEQCAALIDQGKLKIHLSQAYPLEEASIAHQAIETGSITGKLALAIA